MSTDIKFFFKAYFQEIWRLDSPAGVIFISKKEKTIWQVQSSGEGNKVNKKKRIQTNSCFQFQRKNTTPFICLLKDHAHYFYNLILLIIQYDWLAGNPTVSHLPWDRGVSWSLSKHIWKVFKYKQKPVGLWNIFRDMLCYICICYNMLYVCFTTAVCSVPPPVNSRSACCGCASLLYPSVCPSNSSPAALPSFIWWTIVAS